MARATLFSFLATGNPAWANGTVTFYAEDQVTLKSAFTTPDYSGGVGYIANPVQLDVNGTVVAYGSGRYSVKIVVGATTKWYLDLDMIPSLEKQIDVTSYGFNSSALADAVSAAGGDQAVLTIAGNTDIALGTGVGIPSNCVLKFDSGGSAKIVISDGATLVVNGVIDATQRQIFSGNATNMARVHVSNASSPATPLYLNAWTDGNETLIRVTVSGIFTEFSESFHYGGSTNLDSIVLGAPTGGDKGYGTINAENGVFDDGVQLTDFVFEKYFNGKVVDEKHKDYKFTSLDDQVAFVKSNLHLSTITGRGQWDQDSAPSLGVLLNQLWETVETNFIYISELEERLSALENDKS